MKYSAEVLSDEKLLHLFSIEEDHFNDFKAKDISGKNFSKIVSAFANASGGDIYVGIREERETKEKHWEGFNCIEDANSFIQVIESLPTNIADGPSDIPAFSVVKKGGGATFAIYPKGDSKAMQQVEQMREDGRVDMYAEADYSEGTTAYMWITNRIQKMADRIRNAEKEKIMSSASGVPHHLV